MCEISPTERKHICGMQLDTSHQLHRWAFSPHGTTFPSRHFFLSKHWINRLPGMATLSPIKTIVAHLAGLTSAAIHSLFWPASQSVGQSIWAPEVGINLFLRTMRSSGRRRDGRTAPTGAPSLFLSPFTLPQLMFTLVLK